ncbi:Ubiquitin carboxyl-terminal hydrolase isozyme L3 [Smittium culicis]|uniref:ubiquitinyl hydrolase 1 n=1 Tax=Smittium culicis TaxID=133412 RepID=A0A1R1X5F9_9FUNG|nr:Ubiquitin carboxyl-terminal hydrolase isozyme L3 [Smittium culicis]
MSEKRKVYWAPLESNPESMNKVNEFRKELFIKNKEKLSGIENKRKTYLIKQTIGNACGTIAIIHSLANNLNKIELDNGVFKKFIEETIDENPERRGELLEGNSEFANIHTRTASSGQSEQIAADDDTVDLHFVSFIIDENNNLVELDGSLKGEEGEHNGMIVHRKLADGESLISSAAKVIIDYINVDPETDRFSVMSLGPI